MSYPIGERILTRYHEQHLWPLFEQQREKGGHQTFGEFITQSILSQCQTELDLRNLLGISGGRISDIPELLSEYSEKNPLPPDQVMAGTGKQLWWRCSKEIRGEICGHEWQARGAERIKGNGCPACAGKVATAKNNLAVTHPHLIAEYSDRNPLPVTQVVAGTNKSIWWKCSKGHEWQAPGSRRAYQNRGCPGCKNQTVTPENNLVAVYPPLVSEYSDRNPLPASQVIAGSKKKVWWKCSKGHEWQAVVASRVKHRHGCRICKKRITNAEHNLAVVYPQLAAEYSDRNPVPAIKVAPRSARSVWWKCPKGHEWRAPVCNRAARGDGCPACFGRVPTPENNLAITHPHLVVEYSVKNPLPPTEVLAGTSQILLWQCARGHEWKAPGSHRTRGDGCPVCGRRKAGPEENLSFLYPELAVEYSCRNTLPKEQVMIGSHKKVWWKCSKGHEWQAEVRKRVQGLTCRVCAGRIPTPDNNLAVTHPHLMSEYSDRNSSPVTEVTAQMTRRVWWRCEECGYEWKRQIFIRVKGSGCPACKNRVVTAKNNLAVTHPHLIAEYSDRNPLPPDQVIASTSKLLWWKCSKGHEWGTKGYVRVRGSSCFYCRGEKAWDTRRKNQKEKSASI